MRNMREKSFGIYESEPLTIEMVREGLDRDDTSYSEVHKFLVDYGYKDYGWLNSGNVKLPSCSFVKVYSTLSGSSCLFANHDLGVMYSVDMGD